MATDMASYAPAQRLQIKAAQLRAELALEEQGLVTAGIRASPPGVEPRAKTPAARALYTAATGSDPLRASSTRFSPSPPIILTHPSRAPSQLQPTSHPPPHHSAKPGSVPLPDYPPAAAPAQQAAIPEPLPTPPTPTTTPDPPNSCPPGSRSSSCGARPSSPPGTGGATSEGEDGARLGPGSLAAAASGQLLAAISKKSSMKRPGSSGTTGLLHVQSMGGTSVASTWVNGSEARGVSAGVRMHSPPLRVTRSSSPSKATVALQEANMHLVVRVGDLEREVQQYKNMCSDLEVAASQRQASYMRREEAMQKQLDSLQGQLDRLQTVRDSSARERFGRATSTIEQLHSQVAHEIEDLLDRQALAIKHEDAGTLRRFKTRLAEVEAELATEKGISGACNGEWLQRTKDMRKELDTLQIVGLKKEKQRLTIELASMASEAAAAAQERDQLLEQQAAGGQAGDVGGAPGQRLQALSLAGADKEAVQIKVQRYEDVIDSLKKLLEAERRRTRQARAAHTAELGTRTELQTLLRQCVQDVRDRRAAAEAGQAITGGSLNVSGHHQGAASSRAAVSGGFGLQTLNESGDGDVESDSRCSGSGRNPQAGLNTRSNLSPLGSNAKGAMPAVRPGSAYMRPGLGRGMPSSRTRPASATAEMQARPSSAARGALSGPLDDAVASPLDAEGRQALIAHLSSHEDLLKLLFEAAFPAAAPPTLPSDTARLDRLAGARDARDATVVANARVLSAMHASNLAREKALAASTLANATTGSGHPTGLLAGMSGAVSRARPKLPASVAKDATPGSDMQKEAAGKPWVFSVDSMLSEFLGSKPSS
ncbi:hypothetical protein QJQ45_016091 [Haematococcus lacustris]|nr:hypothetical protein QJQ45_016091 [Haematococcus lacustris]